jgi:hypothetical protein
MKHFVLTSLGAFALFTANAAAQTTTISGTSVTAPTVVTPTPVVPPAPGVLSTTESQKTIDGNGDVSASTKTTYGNANGAASDSTTTTTMQPAPPPPPIVNQTTTTTTTSSTGN